MATRLIVLLCCLFGVAAAQPAKKQRSVVLTIVNHDGKPLSRATVWMDSVNKDVDASGRVRFDGIDALENPGVWAPGYAFTTIVVRVDDPTATIAQTVVLDRGSTLSGTVVDSDGKPVPKAKVFIMDDRHTDFVFADDTGAWSMIAIGSGRHLMTAVAAPLVEIQNQPVETDGLTPTTGFVVKLDKGGTLEGVVVDQAGAPIVNATVELGLEKTTTAAGGKFTIDKLRAGTWNLSAKTALGASLDQRVKITSNKRTTARLVILPGTLAGSVADPRGNPIANARIEARQPGTTYGAFGNADATGKFDLGGVVPGDYEITARRPDADYEKGRSAPVTVKAGNRAVGLTIPDTGTIAGRVMVDGKPARYFGIDIAQAYANNPVGRRVADGRFSERDLTGGIWEISVVVPGYLPKRLTATIAGGTVDLGDIVLERGRILHGRVVDDKGLPVAGALVQINTGIFDPPETLREQLDGRIATKTDVDGRYLLSGIRVDQVIRLEARLGDVRSQRKALLKGDDNVELRLRATGELTGTLVNPPADWQKRQIIAHDLADATAFYDVLAHSDGTFDFDHLPAGDYLLYADGRAAERVTIGGGKRTTATIGPSP